MSVTTATGMGGGDPTGLRARANGPRHRGDGSRRVARHARARRARRRRAGHGARDAPSSTTSPTSTSSTVACDILDRRAVRRALRGRRPRLPRRRLDVAARSRDELFRINVQGTRTVLEEALRAGVERVVHTSSVAAIGPAPRGSTADESQAFTRRRPRRPVRARQARGRGRGAARRRARAAGGHRLPRARLRRRRPATARRPSSSCASCAARSPPTSTAR